MSTPVPVELIEPGLAELADRACSVGREAGLVAVGVCDTQPFLEARAALFERRAAGLNGSMAFTYRNPERSTDPQRLLRNAASLVVGAMPYRQARPPESDGDRPNARVARYATDDYYATLRAALERVADELRGAGYRARVVADDNALVDRAAAARAGLGWIGRNTGLITPEAGGEVVLGSVVTDARLPGVDRSVPDGCGSCRACEPACPTGALDGGRLDARRCLAWLVQAPGDFPRRHRVALGDRLYGCDDCTVVCPPSRVAERRHGTGPVGSAPGPTVDVLELLSLDDDTLLERYGRWYVPDRDPDALRRNALVVLGNTGDGGDPATEATLVRHLDGASDLLAGHAAWAALALGRSDLADRRRHRPTVAAELRAIDQTGPQ
ncbi:MAG: tRNA epoxyqueuosine(34) reductase QueG [Microthrixaceae bacterium]|nr:tRNA epoxyqueuosine(34) reductase QueG [Microthrixaceae bacterium]